jgi:hypothetical protein
MLISVESSHVVGFFAREKDFTRTVRGMEQGQVGSHPLHHLVGHQVAPTFQACKQH